MQPLASSCPVIRRSTSSSVSFSPSVAKTWRSSAPITVPFPSLSKTLRPSTKSSNVPWSLALEICCSMGRNVSKSRCLVFISSALGFPSTVRTSALVGLWPRALITSPHWAYLIFISPVGVSSKREKASLNSSIWSAVNSSGTHFRSSSGSLGVSGIGAGAGASSFLGSGFLGSGFLGSTFFGAIMPMLRVEMGNAGKCVVKAPVELLYWRVRECDKPYQNWNSDILYKEMNWNRLECCSYHAEMLLSSR